MMKAIFATFIILLVSIYSYSQSKKTNINTTSKAETEALIKNKIETYAYESNNGKISYKYKLKFVQGILDIYETLNFQGVIMENAIELPLAQISSILIEEKEDTIWLTIKIRDNKPLITTFDEKMKETHSDKCTILLKKSFMDSDLVTRITKAFNHLIKLNGGSILKEVF